MKFKKWYIVFLLFLFIGCDGIPSMKDYRNAWLGLPIEELREADLRPNAWDSYALSIGWKETTYKLDNGNWVYVELDSKNCYIHWEVNPQGIIIGSRVEKTSSPPGQQMGTGVKS